jgi:uncharacterized repeat protein (TIGR03803 family)
MRLKTTLATLAIVAATVLGASAQTFTTLYSFSSFDGGAPYQAPLIQGEDGNLYGTTASGGSGGGSGGTAFRITPQGVLTTLYNFCQEANCPDGTQVQAGLALAQDGNFYGTTTSGGATGWGTVFKLTPDGVLTTLHSFCLDTNCLDGASPYGGLVQATDGNLYGATEQGGTLGSGTVFRITVEGEFTIIYNFCSNRQCADGESPRGNLIQATNGRLYGTTSSGGYNSGGTVFRIGKGGAFTYLDLQNASSGGGPMAGLLQASDGRLYGTTYYGGHGGDEGSLFRVNFDRKIVVLYEFCAHKNCSDGSRPTAALIQATDGSLYGTTSSGGAISCTSPTGNGCGTVFQITPEGKFLTSHTFELSDGSDPNAGLFQATNGILYGVTSSGGQATECGIYGCGTIFSLNVGLAPFVAFVQAAGQVDTSTGILGQGFTGTTSVSLNGTPASFTVVSDTFIKATVPAGATTGYVTVTTPSGTLTSNVPFHVIP